MPREGVLRSTVRVLADGDVVRIATPLAELALPRAWVDGEPAAWPLLTRNLAVSEIPVTSPQLAAVVAFLDDCGAIERLSPRASYTSREIRRWFDAVILDWYAAYYAHPLWAELRAGTLDPGRLLAWVIHNYHVSRAAGISSARCAVRFPRHDLRGALERDTLEEFWHCDAFYFVVHPRLTVDPDAVKRSLPLPATLAVEQQALRMAEDDWLGYLLFAYFQESSIRFLRDAKSFYKDVEQRYRLDAFFGSWLAHISLDLRHGHADVLGALLDTSHTFTATEAHASVRNAWMAYRFLLASLDEIMTTPPSEEPRPLRQSGTLAAAVPRFVVPNDDGPFLLVRATAAFFHALSHATHHDEVMAFGTLARNGVALRDAEPQPPRWAASLWATALANAVDALSVAPAKLASALLHVGGIAKQCGASWPAFDAEALERLHRVAETPGDAALQLGEIYRAWVEEESPPFSDGDVFSASQASTESAFSSGTSTG
jgi:hypothetical protein